MLGSAFRRCALRIPMRTVTKIKAKSEPAKTASIQVDGASGSEFNGFIPMNALDISYSTSSGPGGQHVNKTESRAEVRFRVEEADWIQPSDLRQAFLTKYQHRLNAKGELIVRSERTRSQALNLADCLDKVRFSIREVAEDLANLNKEPSEQDVAKWRRLVGPVVVVRRADAGVSKFVFEGIEGGKGTIAGEGRPFNEEANAKCLKR